MAINRADRAKQFMPFDALKGLQEALREKEIEYDERKELSEDRLDELSEKMQRIEINDFVKITYYHNRFYKTVLGTINKIEYTKKKLIVDGKEIRITDIIEIENI